MNKGFSYYFKKAQNLLSFSLMKKGFASRCVLAIYLFISFLGKLFIFTRPIFVVADNNVAAMLEKSHSFSFSKAFEGTSTKGRYLGLLCTYLVTDSIIAGVDVALVAPFVVFDLVMPGTTTLPIFIIVASVISTIVAVIIELNYSAVGFLAHKTSDFDTSDYLYSSSHSVKDIRGSLFGSSLIIFLIMLVCFAAAPALQTYLIYYFEDEVSVLISLGVLLVIYALYFFVFAPLIMTIKIAHYLQFSDVVLVKKTIVVRAIPGTEQRYVPLFDDQKNEKVGLNLEEDK